jgi:2-C-methyl-D-erythritol 4-phosphate cytidylyltransferase
LQACAEEVDGDDWMLVHDAARPCLSQAMLDRLLADLRADAVGGILAAPVADTLKRQTSQAALPKPCRVPDSGARKRRRCSAMPLSRALQQVGDAVTDEASAIEALGLQPKLVESDMTNLKVTFPADLDVAAWLLASDSN